MAKPEQVLILDPASELHFKGPFTDVVTSYLKLTNPSERRVCFKVKTTAPKKYCVRPNSGVLEAKEVVSVAVMLQPFDYNPTEKNKHKFMVQTMFVPEGDINQENLWRDAKPESLMDSKLRCVFDMPTEATQNSNVETNVVQGDEKTTVSKVTTEPSVKASPKVKYITASSDLELKKLLEENKRLKEEIHQMKQENAQLKEEGMRLRNRGGMLSADSSARSVAAQHASNPSQKESVQQAAGFGATQMSEQPQSPMLYLAVILTIGLLGIFIGKFIV